MRPCFLTWMLSFPLYMRTDHNSLSSLAPETAILWIRAPPSCPQLNLITSRTVLSLHTWHVRDTLWPYLAVPRWSCFRVHDALSHSHHVSYGNISYFYPAITLAPAWDVESSCEVELLCSSTCSSVKCDVSVTCFQANTLLHSVMVQMQSTELLFQSWGKMLRVSEDMMWNMGTRHSFMVRL